MGVTNINAAFENRQNHESEFCLEFLQKCKNLELCLTFCGANFGVYKKPTPLPIMAEYAIGKRLKIRKYFFFGFFMI